MRREEGGVTYIADRLFHNLQQIKLILEVPILLTKAEAQSALGVVSYLRDSIPLVGRFTALLYFWQAGIEA